MQYAVPRGNREYACWPPVDRLPGLVESNASTIDSFDFGVLDLSAAEFRARCLKQLSEAAAEYAGEIGAEGRPPLHRPVIATGHQPELHHCGVWIKNHLAARLASAVGGSSFDLIVDNDVPRHLGIVMPARGGDAWRRAEVPIAASRGDAAFEEYPARIENEDEFRAEAERLAAGMPFQDDALKLAERLLAAAGTGLSLGDVTSAVRLSYEDEAGVRNAELPASRMASTPVFAAFVTSILAEAERFALFYNEALADYRRENGIRNAANPLPDLAVERERIEAPFWIWRPGGRREKLWVIRGEGPVEIARGGDLVGSLEAESFESAAESWRRVISSGEKIRPRALTTTIFMRLFACDLFIHGIGGAKYDEVTDRIIRGFYGVEPPKYATITATLMIDWDFEPADPREIGRLKQAIREIDYNPQRCIEADDPSDEEAELIDEKWRQVSSRPATAAGRRRKFVSIRRINSVLASRLAELRESRVRELAAAKRRLENDRVTFSREYPCFLLGARRACEFYDEVLSPLDG